MKSLIFKSQSPNRGFTLIETLVAVLLLTTAIAGPLTIASRSLVSATVARDQITAFFLAQDAVEFVRYARDSNRLQDEDWLTNLDSCVSSDGTAVCYFDPSITIDVLSCPSGECPLLRYHTSDNYFTYETSNTVATNFRRIMSITTPIDSNSDEALVEVTVEWSSVAGVTGSGCSAGTRCVTVQESIFNWQ